MDVLEHTGTITDDEYEERRTVTQALGHNDANDQACSTQNSGVEVSGYELVCTGNGSLFLGDTGPGSLEPRDGTQWRRWTRLAANKPVRMFFSGSGPECVEKLWVDGGCTYQRLRESLGLGR